MMYHAEWFNVSDAQAARRFFKERFLPYLRGRGMQVWILVTQHGLGPGQFALVTAMERWGCIDEWAAQVEGGEDGRQLMDEYRRLRLNSGTGTVVQNLDVD